MLELIRKYATGFIAIIIILFIGIPFAFQGIQSYMGGGKADAIATVNGLEISEAEFIQVYQRARQRIINAAGGKFDPDQINEQALKKNILQGLIKQKLVVMQAMSSGYRVGNNLLAESIKGMDQFQQDGKFNQAQYTNTIRQQGYSEQQFEELLRQDMVSEQLQGGISNSVVVPNREIREAYRIINQKRDISYMVISAGRFITADAGSDEEIKQYYELNKDQFRVPEKVKLSYLRLSIDELAKSVKVAEEDIRTYYEQQKANFSTPEERQVSHIMLKSSVADKTKPEEAREKLAGIRKMILAGASFEEMAKLHSEDKGSASSGGDLGIYVKGMMDDTFDKAVDALSAGEVSDIVETKYGLHLVKLTRLVKSKTRPLSEVRATLEKEYRRSQVENQFHEMADKLTNLTYENPETLEVAAHALELPIKESGFFSRTGGEGIAENPKVVAKAFGEDVLQERLNSEVIEMGLNDLVVMRVKEHTPASIKPLEDVRPRISDMLRITRAQNQAEQQGKQVISMLAEKKADADKLAVQQKSQWVKKPAVSRTAKDVNAQILNHAFVMPRPDKDAPSVDGVRLNTGDYAVLQLGAVKDADASVAKADELQQIGASLARLKATAEYSSYIEDLYRKADVKINEAAL